MALKAVVLPAPLGPMRLVIEGGRTTNDTPARAVTPPNDTWRSSTTSISARRGAGPHRPRAGRGAGRARRDRRDDAARQEEHEHDEDDAVREHLPLPGHGLTQRLGERREEQGADHR